MSDLLKIAQAANAKADASVPGMQAPGMKQ